MFSVLHCTRIGRESFSKGCAVMEPYELSPLPPKGLDFRSLNRPTGDATAELCRYDGLLQGITNPALFLSPLTVQEAVLSSRIEGTQATLDEVLGREAGMEIGGSKEQDIQEIINYREALSQAQIHLADYPITLSFICGLHKILLDSVRGQNKNPGELRMAQNWIGRPGSAMEEATYIPPDPLRIRDYLENMLAVMNEMEFDVLVQTGILHAQFELIHPFDDGNGRIGRILIPLYLYQRKRISQPMFYLSAYLERHHDEYNERLLAISRDGDWNGWIAFFLRAVTEQARINSDKVRKIMGLHEKMKHEIQELTRSQYTVAILDELFSRPIFSSSGFISRSGIPRPTANKLLGQLKEAGFIVERRPGRGRQPTVFSFPLLLKLTEDT